jgi:mono/diheme cytochrome c family protein
MVRQTGSVAGGAAALALIVFVLLGSGIPGSAPSAAQNDGPTFYADVLPILEANCQVCHQSGDVKTGGMIAPMALQTYEQTRPWALAIARAVTDGKMPPWSADVQHKGTFEGERYLTENEKKTLVSWERVGAPAGNPSSAPAVTATRENSAPGASAWLFGRPDLVVNFAKPVQVADEVADWQPTIFVPVTKDQHPEDRWVRAAELQAGGPYVHHIVSSHLGVGTPGRGPFMFPKGWGTLLPIDPVITFNMHYYKKPGQGTAIQDETRGGFQFYRPGDVIDYVVQTDINSSGRSLLIPKGHANYEVTWARPFKEDSYLLSMGPHAHYRGKSFQYALEHPDGRREVLLWIPKYDFNWQHLYQFKEPRFIPAGSKLIATWHFDNSTGNRFNPDPTRDVPYGEETFNEMANARIYYASATKRGIVVGEPIPEDVLAAARRAESARREQLRRTGVVPDHN